MKLQEYEGYIVDYRLRQFRSQPPENGVIEFVSFDSRKGVRLLLGMVIKGLVPDEQMSTLPTRTMSDEEGPVYTPILKSTGVRFTIKDPIFEEGFRYGRGLGKKGIVRDPQTGKRYEISGKACSLSNCKCDALAEEISK